MRMGCTTPIRFIPSMVAPPASNRTVAKRSSATLEELTLNGDGVANATFITDRELSNSIALAAEVEIARHKYPYKTLKQPSAKKSHITYRKSHYSNLISHIPLQIRQQQHFPSSGSNAIIVNHPPIRQHPWRSHTTISGKISYRISHIAYLISQYLF